MGANVSELLSQMPALEGDKRIKPETWEFMTAACETALSNPTENVIGIIDQFQELDNGKDYRARYLLRGVITVAGAAENKGKLEAVISGIVTQLQANKPKTIKAALLRELRFAGTPSAAKAIAPYLTDDELYFDACNALRSIKEGATALLVAALPQAQGKARTEIIHALAALGEAEGLASIKGALADKELDTRLAAAWGIARCADASSADALLAAANGAADWERIQLTDSCLRLAENLAAAGKKAESKKIYGALAESRTDASEKYIAEASRKMLASI